MGSVGDVCLLDKQYARQSVLAYVNSAGNAIIKVDNTSTVPYNQKRNSVRITTQDSYNYGSLWIIDILHLPFGCSVREIRYLHGYPELMPHFGRFGLLSGPKVCPM